jgi:hypothetical protein
MSRQMNILRFLFKKSSAQKRKPQRWTVEEELAEMFAELDEQEPGWDRKPPEVLKADALLCLQLGALSEDYLRKMFGDAAVDAAKAELSDTQRDARSASPPA